MPTLWQLDGAILPGLSSWGDDRVRLAPGDPRRELEQRHQQLPVGVSQQRDARQPQRQPWLPPAEHTAASEEGIYGFSPRASGHVQAVILRRCWPAKQPCPATFGRPCGREDRRGMSGRQQVQHGDETHNIWLYRLFGSPAQEALR